MAHDPAPRLPLVVALLSASTLVAQDPFPAVPKFAIDPAPLALTGDVRPHQYVGVIGRQAAWLGVETGQAELWVHPLKLASDFRLDFRIPDYVDPVRGADVARTVEVRPELTTITYAHATFTVRQHILAPLNAPGLLVLLDVETLQPLEVIASFRMVFQYAWPGAFGGQYTFWDEGQHAFVLSESLRERNGMIGSPWAATASSHPAHALPDAPNTFVIPVDSARAAREFIPIAVTAGIAPRDSVIAWYRGLLTHAEALYREKRAHVDALLAHATALDTPDDALDRAFAWSLVNLDESLSCNPDLGCGLVAGWGLSGTSGRPGFGWFFGGDAAVNSFAMSSAGMWDHVAQGLRFLARYQREDGKIPHEVSQAAGRVPWFTDFPYAYYHGDTTPFWIVALWRYWRASGDDALVHELWDAVERAYAWCLTRETDGDGIIENGPGNLGAIEVGALGEGIHQDIYLAAVWIEALDAMTELARFTVRHDLADEAQALHARARRTLNDRYWRERDGHHAFGILQSGGTNDNLTVWPATAAAFRLLDHARADRTLAKLAGDAISTDWGAHILSTESPLYDAMHYNNGTVWPFVTGFVTWGQYNYLRPWSAFPLVDAVKQITFDWARGRHPELFSGSYYRPLDTAVPQQFFATSMLVSPLLSGMLGWDPYAAAGHSRLIPQLPPQWDGIRVRNLRVAETALDVEIVQTDSSQTITVTRAGPPIVLEVTHFLPAGATRVRTSVAPAEGAGEEQERRTDRGLPFVVRRVPLDADVTTFSAAWSGGLAVEPPLVALEPGQTSAGLRVLDFRWADEGWRLDVEGDGGHSYELRLRGAVPTRAVGAAIVRTEGTATTIRVTLPGGVRRATHSVRLER